MPTFEELRQRHRKQIFGAAKNAQAFKNAFEGPDGDYVLQHLCKKFHVFDGTIAKTKTGELDIHQTLLNEGKRMVVLDILKAAKRDTLWIEKQLEEAINEGQE